MKSKYLIALLLLCATGVSAQDPTQLKAKIAQLQRQVDSLTIAARPRPQGILSQMAFEPVEPIHTTEGVIPLDTLSTINDAVKVVIYNDNSWKYIRDKEFIKDSSVYVNYWDTKNLFPYNNVSLSELPSSIAIDLVDSLRSYHYPQKGKVRSPYGVRRWRQHQGVDIPLKTGDPVYSTFNGRVRISEYNRGGYGNLIIIRHDNGLETFYGHLSERFVQPGDWVEAGQVIGLGGSTGRSSGPHLHFETRYFGQTFDPERLIDFETGVLRRQTFLLKKSFFDIHSNAAQDFGQENEIDQPKPQVNPVYHKIKSGDTLGAIARRYGTTVSKICSLNGIKSTTILRIGRTLRVK